MSPTLGYILAPAVSRSGEIYMKSGIFRVFDHNIGGATMVAVSAIWRVIYIYIVLVNIML